MEFIPKRHLESLWNFAERSTRCKVILTFIGEGYFITVVQGRM